MVQLKIASAVSTVGRAFYLALSCFLANFQLMPLPRAPMGMAKFRSRS
jgi:hypothetical protein